MSTILDALRKAQEETRGGRDSRVDTVPGGDGPTSPRRRGPRRLVVWVAAVAGVLIVAFVGGLALGHRVMDFFGGASETADAPPGQQIATDQKAPAAAAPVAPRAAEVAKPAKAAPVAPVAPAERMAVAQNQAKVAPAPAPAQQPAASGDSAPAPAARHVFGAAALPPQGKDVTDEDRAARLQQLRDRMLKARQDARAGAGANGGEKNLVPIIVPPPRDQAPAPARQPAVAVAGSDDAGAQGTAARVASDGAAAAPAPKIDPIQVASAPRAVAAAPPGAAAALRDALAAVGAGAVGVSVKAAHDDSGEGEVPDAGAAAPDAVAKPAAEPPPTTLASLPPPAAAAPAQPQVLRRAPGGAPQVAINILQWSAEPERRFAFVSVDGGGMTQVREGDHIGGLTVKHIHEQTIEFGYNDSSFVLRAN